MGLNSQQEKNNGSKSMLGKKVPQFMYFSLSVAEPKKKKNRCKYETYKSTSSADDDKGFRFPKIKNTIT